MNEMIWVITSILIYFLMLLMLIKHFYRVYFQERMETELYKELYSLSPMIATIYVSTRSIKSALKTLKENLYQNKLIQDRYEHLLNNFLAHILMPANKREIRPSEELILDIMRNPMEYMDRTTIESIYNTLIDDIENYKLALEEKDERLSFLLFTNFFLPFVVVLVGLFFPHYFDLIKVIIPLINLGLVYLTIEYLKDW